VGADVLERQTFIVTLHQQAGYPAHQHHAQRLHVDKGHQHHAQRLHVDKGKRRRAGEHLKGRGQGKDDAAVNGVIAQVRVALQGHQPLPAEAAVRPGRHTADSARRRRMIP